MIALLKVVHICGIAIWVAGLLALPGLYVRRTGVAAGPHLDRLQDVVRYAYIVLISPAAFVAVASGIALIFLRDVFTPWFSLKMAAVTVLVVVHVLAGLVVIRLFREDETYPRWRLVGITTTVGAAGVAILYLVLAKPVIDPGAWLPAVMSEPGGLRRAVEGVNPWATP